MKKILITNVAYGPEYVDIFLNHHLKSLLDETNIPAFKERIEYRIFTDLESQPHIANHPNVHALSALIPVDFGVFEFPPEATDKFNERYSVLINTFKWSVKLALERGHWLSPMVADLVVAKDYFAKLFHKMDEGHDSVFVLPMRTAFERMAQELPATGALPAIDLFELGYKNLHPLWVACHWEAAQFTKLPFTLLWNAGNGLLARSFSITPIVFEPIEEMLEVNQVIDVEVPHLLKNPFWATDWIECPVIGVEPLQCYYPPFANAKASIKTVKKWAECLHASQKKFLERTLYFPAKASMHGPGESFPMFVPETMADLVVTELLRDESIRG